MITVTGTVRSTLDASNAFEYLAAFEHTPEWDPGTPVVKKLSDGPVAVGHRYHAEAEFRGKRQTLIYEVVELAGTRHQTARREQVCHLRGHDRRHVFGLGIRSTVHR